jgi:hypothetical protein
MDTPTFTRLLADQFNAALSMLDEAIRRCPPERWDDHVGVYPFWQVAYHVLCFVDCYAYAHNDAWEPDQRPEGMHPRGRTELDEEFPSRRFEQADLLAYLARGRDLVRHALAAETDTTLRGPSGFSHLPFTRAEHHLHSLRHVQHHTGQLTAFLRRVSVDTRWRKTGWPIQSR